jgi:hypothetical protein
MQIEKTDLLWRLYCLAFEIEGKAVTPPSNICPYFWTAMKGLRLYLKLKAPLKYLWLCAIGLFLLSFGSVTIVRNVNVTLGHVMFIPAFTLFAASFFIAAMSSFIRLGRWIEKRFPWAIYVTMFIASIFGIIVAVSEIKSGTFWQNFKGIGTPIMIGVPIICFLMVIAFNLPSIRKTNLVRTIIELIKAKKNKWCPPVKPPMD